MVLGVVASDIVGVYVSVYRPVVAGLKNGELVMTGVVGGDCRDKMANRLPISYS